MFTLSGNEVFLYGLKSSQDNYVPLLSCNLVNFQVICLHRNVFKFWFWSSLAFCIDKSRIRYSQAAYARINDQVVSLLKFALIGILRHF